MDAIELLRKQHAQVKSLLERIEEADDEDKEELFEQIADAMAIHAAIEEKHFYPATKSARTEELLQEAVEEHLSVKRIIADLLELEPSDAQFDAKVKVLKEQIEHHVEEEQSELFPKVRRILSQDELDDLGLVMEDLADDLESDGAPRESIPGETAEAAPLE